ncbi:MAG: endonuclease III domain-containing protein [Candidatus Aenigmarchaeota archaeon]|nr:endonuclease III domain-containing protein [Candidatus Aenigmarchaeota archaeon]
MIFMIMKNYKELLKKYGKQNWWPSVTKKEFEICLGAILTQNTNWKNVEKAIANLIDANAMDPESILNMPTNKLEELIKPSGFFKQKTKRLKEFSKFVLSYGSFENFKKNATREQLLNVNGIGKETADSILLYACGKPYFVVDTYTRRLFSNLGLIKGDEKYDNIRQLFESKLPKDVELYKEFHALIVKHGKMGK